LSEASQKITDKISEFRSEQNKAPRSEISHEIEVCAFNNNHTALIFGSFHQGKEQIFYFKRDFHLFYFVAASWCIAKKGGAKSRKLSLRFV
jgi:hypothetical protein